MCVCHISCSQLHCVHFNTWDSSKDWTTPLPAKESIKVCIASDCRLREWLEELGVNVVVWFVEHNKEYTL